MVGLVSVIHEALLTADQVQPAATVRAIVPVVADWDTVRLVGEIEGVHVAEKANVFEAVLAVVPPGPIAETRASYVTVGAGALGNNGRKSTRIMLLAFGVGLPMSTVANGVGEPTG